MLHAPKPQANSEPGTIGRRTFLGALAAVSIPSVAPEPAGAGAGDEIEEDKRKARYRETEEVKTFYRVNRYPGQGG